VISTRRLGVLLVGLAVAVMVGCGGASPEDRLALRMYTEHYSFRITPNPLPPHAREKTRYKVVVRDKESGQPIEGGEGIIYANTREGASTWDTFVPGQELGTYYATLNFVVSGQWALGLRFRRDSTQRLEQLDWMQEVLAERSSIP
jgi:hypothetical protein